MDNVSIEQINFTIFSETNVELNKTATYLNMILLIAGTIDNFMTFYVLLHKPFRKRIFNWYLLTLTIFEFIFCFTAFIDFIFLKIFNQESTFNEFQKISFLIIDYVIVTSDTCIGVITILLSMDRLYAIRNPMKLKVFFTNLHAIKTITISIFLIVLLKTLSFTYCAVDSGSKMHILYCSLVSPLIFNIVPWTFIFILNVLLAKEMCHHNGNSDPNANRSTNVSYSTRNTVICINRNQSVVTVTRSNNREQSTTQRSHYIVIFVSSLWSILTSIPYYCLNNYFYIFQLNFFSHYFEVKTIITSQAISSVFFNLNHCINFLIYLSFYSEFRKFFINLFF